MPACHGSRTVVAIAPDQQPATVDPHLHLRLPDTRRQVWFSLLWGHCSFLLGPGAHKVLLCLPSVCFPGGKCKCVSRPVVADSVTPRTAAHQALLSRLFFPGGPQSFCWIPRLGSLLWALEILQQCENLFGVIVLQFVGHLLSGSVVGLTATSSKRTYATHRASQGCCSQSPCPCDRPSLTCASTGDAQTV